MSLLMWDVIEHVPDPVDLLRKVRGLATENTRLFVLTMSTNSITYKIFGQRWNYINPTQHLFYFSHETMARALREAGWHLISVEMDDSRTKNSVHLMARILLGSLNVLFFKIYAPHRNVFKLLKPFLRPFQGDLTDERMCKRLENLFPGYYVGRYHANFVLLPNPRINHIPHLLAHCEAGAECGFYSKIRSVVPSPTLDSLSSNFPP